LLVTFRVKTTKNKLTKKPAKHNLRLAEVTIPIHLLIGLLKKPCHICISGGDDMIGDVSEAILAPLDDQQMVESGTYSNM
jgi:hypothetical protein